MLKNIIKALKNLIFQSRNSNWIYLVVSLLFFVLSIAGYGYGATYYYALPGFLCLLQYFYPTVIGHLIFSTIFAVVSCGYFLILAMDIMRMIQGIHPKILVDFGDSFVFILLFIFLIIITFIMVKNLLNQKKNREKTTLKP